MKTRPRHLLVLLLPIVVVAVWLYRTSTAPEPEKPGPPVPDRIVFITIDTLRADHVGSYGYLRDTTPFLDSLAANGVLFQNSYAACSHTGPSHASMFTSLYPYQHGLLRNGEVLRAGPYTMQAMFQESGYKTAAFSAVGFMEGNVGFSALDEKFDTAFPKKNHWYRNASENMDRVLSWLDDNAQTKKFFLWVHFYDVHQWRDRKNIPKSYLEDMEASGDADLVDFITEMHNIPIENHGGQKGLLRAINGYDARLRFVDDQLQRLSDHLEQKQLSDNALWLVTADHGEGLGNHNYRGHGQYIYDEQLSVPLIIHHTAFRFPRKRIRNIARTVDFLPTLAELINKPLEQGHLEGTSLIPFMTDAPNGSEKVEYSFAQRRPKDVKSFRTKWEDGEIYSLQSLSHKFIYHSMEQDEFYDLRADPFELKNLIESENPEKENLKRLLLEILHSPAKAVETEEIELDPETVQELEALGYL